MVPVYQSMDLLGMSVRVEVSDPATALALGPLVRCMPATSEPTSRTIRLLKGGDGGPGSVIYDGDVLISRHLSGARVINVFLWYLNHLALQTHRFAVVHAGAIASDGRAVILPAPMDAGKSTLVTALVLRQFDYLSDEFAAIDLEDGRVVPYPSAIGLDAGSFSLFPELKPETSTEFYDPSHWYIAIPRTSCVPYRSHTVVAIVFPTYSPGAKCSVIPVDDPAALALVANETLNFFDLGHIAFRAIGMMVRRAPTYRLLFGNLDDACAAISRLVEAGAP